uniref:hypothetical protein ycf23 n=1 Tax=Nemalion vermiculare TaxID=935621 RepID=UPI00257FCB42|nr:hypothetical protein ycf23 [Nemalion vermiculare]WGV34360.1 hypothetical protein ycf23 [Nemalion vermiculare]
MTLNSNISEACKQKQMLKVIIGIDNFDISDIMRKVKAAHVGGATYIDISANCRIIDEVKFVAPSLPVCVSSIDVNELVSCYDSGADMLELGNFDTFYARGISFSSQQILDLTNELLSRIPDASICATIPHTLSLIKQLDLAKRLEQMGVDMIQTEGISSRYEVYDKLSNSIKKASASLSSTAMLSDYLTIPVTCSSGINSLNAPLAISYGASGVGIGSFLHHFDHSLDLSHEIFRIMKSIKNNYNMDESIYSSYFELDRPYVRNLIH